MTHIVIDRIPSQKNLSLTPSLLKSSLSWISDVIIFYSITNSPMLKLYFRNIWLRLYLQRINQLRRDSPFSLLEKQISHLSYFLWRTSPLWNLHHIPCHISRRLCFKPSTREIFSIMTFPISKLPHPMVNPLLSSPKVTIGSAFSTKFDIRALSLVMCLKQPLSRIHITLLFLYVPCNHKLIAFSLAPKFY